MRHTEVSSLQKRPLFPIPAETDLPPGRRQVLSPPQDRTLAMPKGVLADPLQTGRSTRTGWVETQIRGGLSGGGFQREPAGVMGNPGAGTSLSAVPILWHAGPVAALSHTYQPAEESAFTVGRMGTSPMCVISHSHLRTLARGICTPRPDCSQVFRVLWGPS